MLRDRCPEVVSQALLFCKVKTRWINHCYSAFIGIYKTNEDRNMATRTCLGLSHSSRNFDFHKTIDWDNLTQEETQEWKRVESWVEWFRHNMLILQDKYDMLKKQGESDYNIKVVFISTYLNTLLPSDDEPEEVQEEKYKYVNNLADFLVKCCQNKV